MRIHTIRPVGAVALGMGLATVMALRALESPVAASHALTFGDAAVNSIADGAGARGGMADADPCEPAWLPTGGGAPSMNHPVHSLVVYDDGSGPALYAGGRFDVAGGVEANHVARWDGSSWSPLGGGITREPATPTVRGLVGFDDGSGAGPMLYAGGEFTHADGALVNSVARWDGSSWSGLSGGVDGYVLAMLVHDDGSGPALYVGGDFTTAGGVVVNNIARWDGSVWSELGFGTTGVVTALGMHDDGSGPALYVGANTKLERWDGSSWTTVAELQSPGYPPVTSPVAALLSHDDGSGPVLYVGGSFSSIDGVPLLDVARWDGSSWSPLDSGIDNGGVSKLFSLVMYDDGSGPAIYAGGQYSTVGGLQANGLARWDGTSWCTVDGGTGGQSWAMVVHDDGSGAGESLYVGGNFNSGPSGLTGDHIARWNGAWSLLAESSLSGDVRALTTWDDGSGESLYAAGLFVHAGSDPVNRVARWDGAGWSALGSGITGQGSTSVNVLATHDDGGSAGPALYAGGHFTTAGGVSAAAIARWNGAAWSALGSGISGGSVTALAVYDDGSGAGPTLYAGGNFDTAGGASANGLARWDGATWSDLGLMGAGDVEELLVHDDGSGPALYVGGSFSHEEGADEVGVARWDGSSWTALDGDTAYFVTALAAYDDGNGEGEQLYAGGAFVNGSGVDTWAVARWDGASWSLIGEVDDMPEALGAYDDGGGPALYAAGRFTIVGGVAVTYIARWDGNSWSAAGGEVTGDSFDRISALAVFDDRGGSGPRLYAGGNFLVSPAGDSYLGSFGGCATAPHPCDFDGSGSVGFADLVQLLIHWGDCAPCAGAACPWDVDGSCAVEFADLVAVLLGWG